MGSSRDETWRRVRSAGVELLFEHGYEAMNTRQLAEAAELKPGSLYYYFRSKEEFLYRLLVDLLEEIVADLELELGAIDPDDVEARLETFVRVLVKWHITRHKETFIASIETRALSRARHESYIELRDRFDSMLHEILRDGTLLSRFDIVELAVTRNSILSMITALSGWYDPHGPLGLEEITSDFVLLVRRMVGT
ncbi:TetR/AcrR family transcriptional regulator [Rhodococcus sp. SMB37]|uniref:TetR/AcrR family transcriptional regulator n=1 Tax=Rhodococcus sp. SMB37 TaxID=2512213 RepID=UPI00241159C9|nr:TetR/AcrR family transcriptional regulator [Rhodococcus sp. SMB37]